ncbi:MAG: futalosine hydrolase [Desulfovibrio sp.]|nr:futalosine hydrolase [Desulfovibrio sp.]
MALLICSATAQELAQLAPDRLPANIIEMQPMQLELAHGAAIFIATGVGPVNASLSIGLCLGLTHASTGSKIAIDGIIYAGLAGAFDLNLTPLCSIWRVSREIWPEYGLNDGNSVTARAFKHPLWQRDGQEDIYDSIELADYAAMPRYCRPKSEWPACASLTVAGVSASFARRNALWDAWHVELENMEGFAAAYAAARAEIPLLEIRVVSNKVGPRGRGEKDFEGALAEMKKILPGLGLL